MIGAEHARNIRSMFAKCRTIQNGGKPVIAMPWGLFWQISTDSTGSALTVGAIAAMPFARFRIIDFIVNMVNAVKRVGVVALTSINLSWTT